MLKLFIFCTSFVLNFFLACLGIYIIEKCKRKQSEGFIRNIEDKKKDKFQKIWFIISLFLNLFTFLLIFIKNELFYFSTLFLVMVLLITSYYGWNLTNRCDNETMFLDNHKRDLYFICILISLLFYFLCYTC